MTEDKRFNSKISWKQRQDRKRSKNAKKQQSDASTCTQSVRNNASKYHTTMTVSHQHSGTQGHGRDAKQNITE